MMDCAQYRRSLLTDPLRPSAEMQVHVASCHDCGQYAERVLGFERRLGHALQVRTDEGWQGRAAPLRALSRQDTSRRRRRGLAIAASVLLASFGAASLWLVAPGKSLAADVVNHMAGEPDAWLRTDVAVPQPRLGAVMSESELRLKPGAGLVSYAQSCLFRGHQVPHLVVQTGKGPVTVMLLTHEFVRRDVNFDEQGYKGMIVPVRGHGSIAVLEQGNQVDGSTIRQVASRLLNAIEWSPSS